ncbi:MAG: hypothetical protein IJN92_08300 [Lachnospiraceae bacterium]|nr:hypothetical protein [Lachnospiraceae bacterium]
MEERKKTRRVSPLQLKMVGLTVGAVLLMAIGAFIVVNLHVEGMESSERVSIVRDMAIIAVIAVVIEIIVVNLIVSGMVKALNRSLDILQAAASGDLTKDVANSDLARKDEMGILANGVADVLKSLKELIARVSTTTDAVNDSVMSLNKMAANSTNSSESVAQTMTEMANGATQQAIETQAVSEAVHRIGDEIEQTAEAAQFLMQTAEGMKKTGAEGSESVQELENISAKVKEQIAIIYEQTNTTNESAQEIHKATELIASIANETNLLALNASIEAARAGESGRGFAVVAEQIKNLAEQSNQSAKTIEDIISHLLEQSEQAVKTMNTVDAIIGLQADKVEITKGVFDHVNEGLLATVTGIERISNSANELENAKGQVVSSIETLSAIAEQNAAATQETAASTEELAATMENIAEEAGRLDVASKELVSSMNAFQIYG